MKNKNTRACYIIIVIYNYCRVAVVVERGEDEGVNVKCFNIINTRRPLK